MNKSTRITYFLLLVLASLHLTAQKDKPNVIVILADDLGYADVGFNGCQDIPTPNIDKIATNGVKFTNGYTSYSVCGPSRAGLITGRYQQRFGFERNPQYNTEDPNMGLTLNERTLASALKTVGYTSSVIGKWHLGAHESLHPLNRGFDEFYGHLGGGHRYLPEDLNIVNSEDAHDEEESYYTWILRDHTPVQTDEYLTDEFSNEAVSFIERNKDNPFFIYLSYNAPHGPLQATDKYLDRFPDLTDKRKIYAAMVSALDDGVGHVLDKLQELNIEENTLVFFLSDNGGPETKNASDNGILRGGKSDTYEGGFRVPFALQWKGTLAENTICDTPVSALDIFATATALAGVSENPNKPLDGVNLIPYLTNQTAVIPHETIYLRKYDQQKYAVRHGDYKLLSNYSTNFQSLYNLKDDISESTNILESNPVITSNLEAIRDAWDAELMPPTFDGIVGITVPDPTYQINYLGNDDFENYNENSNIINLSPSIYSKWGDVSWTIEKSNGNGVNGSNQYAKSNASAEVNLKRTFTNLEVGKSYVFRIYTQIKNEPDADKRSHKIQVVSGEHTYNTTSINRPNSDEWIETAIEFTVLQNFDNVELQLYRNHAGGNVLVDNFSLEENFNYIKNHDFELGSLIDWNTWNNDISDSEDDVYQGDYAGKLLSGKTGSLQQEVYLKSNTAYVFSCSIKASDEGQSLKMIVKDKAKNTNYVNKTIYPTTSYQKYSETFTTGNLNTPLSVSLWKNIANENTIFLDNFELYEVGTSEPQLFLNSDDLENLVVDLDYQARVIVAPHGINLGTPIWQIENQTGSANITEDGIISTTSEGTFLLKVYFDTNPNFSISKQLTIEPRTLSTYYVDATLGNDNNDGLSENSAWNTLTMVNGQVYKPGDKVLLKTGEVWNGQLEIHARGTENYPVVISSFGTGDKPIINGKGEKDYTLLLNNAHHTTVKDLELTNKGTLEKGNRFGVLINADNTGPIYNTTVENLTIHDVNGHGEKTQGGGGAIVYQIKGAVDSYFVNLKILNNHIYNVRRNGIYGKSNYDTSVLSQNTLIKGNVIEQIPGDGIIAWSSKNAIVEHNICRNFSDDLPDVSNNAAAGIWAYKSNDTKIQYNEVSGHKSKWDGQGFDSDFWSNGTIIQYNYSHDNLGGFLLVVCNGEVAQDGISKNTNTIVRYNISINDGYRTLGSGANFSPSIHMYGPTEDTKIYNNTIYLGPKPASVENEILNMSTWNGGYPDKNFFFNNIFYSLENTKFSLSESTNTVFDYNLYFGPITLPSDPHNFLFDPLFVDSENHSSANNYQIQEMSPAVNRGKVIVNNGGFDFFGNPVSNTSAPTIGAHEVGKLLNIDHIYSHRKLLFDISNGTIVVDNLEILTKKELTNANIKIIALNGKIVFEKSFNGVNNKKYQFSLNSIESGVYLIQITSHGMKQVEKFIKR